MNVFYFPKCAISSWWWWWCCWPLTTSQVLDCSRLKLCHQMRVLKLHLSAVCSVCWWMLKKLLQCKIEQTTQLLDNKLSKVYLFLPVITIFICLYNHQPHHPKYLMVSVASCYPAGNHTFYTIFFFSLACLLQCCVVM